MPRENPNTFTRLLDLTKMSILNDSTGPVQKSMGRRVHDEDELLLGTSLACTTFTPGLQLMSFFSPGLVRCGLTYSFKVMFSARFG